LTLDLEKSSPESSARTGRPLTAKSPGVVVYTWTRRVVERLRVEATQLVDVPRVDDVVAFKVFGGGRSQVRSTWRLRRDLPMVN
jgi:hypothetical protein